MGRLTRGSDEATVYLKGACLTSYKTDGVEWLGVRNDAVFDGSKYIAAGLPLCWPNFGPGKGNLPQHGFAKDLTWRVLDEETSDSTCTLVLTDSEETRAMWPHSFRCVYRLELRDGRLSSTFRVENLSEIAFGFQAALHSYYSVEDTKTCTITGKFTGADKVDKTVDPQKHITGESDSIRITKFTEEIYKNIFPGSVSVSDPSKGDLIIEHGEGWRDAAIWNPHGNERMGADRFVCVESAAIDEVLLHPKATWIATMGLVPKPKS